MMQATLPLKHLNVLHHVLDFLFLLPQFLLVALHLLFLVSD